MRIFLFLFLFFLTPAFPDLSPGKDDILISPIEKSRLSNRLNIPLSQIRLDPVQMRLSSNFPLLPFHEILIQSPLDSADVIHRLTQVLETSPLRLENLIHNASILINQRIGSVPEYQWPDSSPDSKRFQELLSTLTQSEKPTEKRDWQEETEQKFLALPIPLQSMVLNFISSMSQTVDWMQEGRDSISSIVSIQNLEDILLQKDISPHELNVLEQVMKNADRKSLFRASAMIASCLSAFLLAADGFQSVSFDRTVTLSCPAGDIILAGTLDDIHEYQRPPLLLIDWGGNDIYKGCYAQSNPDVPVSIAIDMKGEDRYQSDSTEFGNVCGVAGLAALLDLGMEADYFQGITRCFSYSFCGISILYDEGGDSDYQAQSLCLAASDMGISILFDEDGRDTYQANAESQGYADMGGLGLLIEAFGNDRYIAPATPVVNPSAQVKTCNFSASQGFGTGRFGPTQDGHSFPGGIGILLDESGDDVYQASVFAQGSGYGYGIGILADRAGNDRYQGVWYTMGSAAHQGCGLLIDENGDDCYEISHYMMAGAATDFSLGLFVDINGNDRYQAQNAALGYSLLNSFSLFLDREGDDRYSIANHMGAGIAHNEFNQALRDLWPTFGFFIDSAGMDDYKNLPNCTNNSQWDSPPNDREANSHGFGIDLSSTETNP